jgi:Tfp pilus assembly protein PilX
MLYDAAARRRGFSLVIVMAAVTLLGLLTMAALHLALDQRRRAGLTIDHALAKQAAEKALADAECELSVATGTPSAAPCTARPSPERIAALNPVTLSGFVAGTCGEGVARGLCQPLTGQSLWALATLLEATSHGVEVDTGSAVGARHPAHRARYVIEPIPDARPGQWIQAGAAPQPRLFRITAAGFGADPEVSVVLQTVFRPGASSP